VEWGATAEGWADVVIWIDFDATGLPPGIIEFYMLMDSDLVLLAELAPHEDYRHGKVTQVPGEIWSYCARYRTAQEVGPMSAMLEVEIPPP
jgi:hypothetical protein